VREGAHVLGLIQNLRRQRNVSIILIVHNYNQVFEEELIRIVKSGLGREAIAAAAAEVQRQMGQS
jgi:simple sugar transport system ATP-binding protein